MPTITIDLDDDQAKTILGALIPSLGISDRRSAPRSKTARKPRAKRNCPANGCQNAFSPRYGGYCADHRGTAGFKKWEAEKAAKKR